MKIIEKDAEDRKIKRLAKVRKATGVCFPKYLNMSLIFKLFQAGNKAFLNAELSVILQPSKTRGMNRMLKKTMKLQ